MYSVNVYKEETPKELFKKLALNHIPQLYSCIIIEGEKYEITDLTFSTHTNEHEIIIGKEDSDDSSYFEDWT